MRFPPGFPRWVKITPGSNPAGLPGQRYGNVRCSFRLDCGDINLERYIITCHKNHTLYNGTEILQANNISCKSVTALVVATGFATTKGRLIKSIIFPKPIKLKFFRDSMRFILCLAVLAGLGKETRLIDKQFLLKQCLIF